MIYNFFADKQNKIQVLDFIFNETDLQIYDSTSQYEQEISQYKSAAEIVSRFDLENGGKASVAFELWSPAHKCQPCFKRIELDPKYCNGHTFRYSTEGWGLIQLYFGGTENNKLNSSHVGHLEEKNALKWEETNPAGNKVSEWDWKAIQSTSRKLKRFIQNKIILTDPGN